MEGKEDLPEKLWKEIEKNQKTKLSYILKRIYQIKISPRFGFIARIFFNRCDKCGGLLVYYYKRNNKKVKICDRCYKIDPARLIYESEYQPGHYNKKVYASYFSEWFVAIFVLLVIVSLTWAHNTSKEGTKQYRKNRIKLEQPYQFPSRPPRHTK